jgi:hypothetical protein
MCIFKLTDMRKILAINSILAFMLVFPMMLDAQNALKVRLSGNLSRFLGEPQGDEVIYPLAEIEMGPGPFSDFANQSKFGFEAEVMLSLTEKAWIGLELSSSRFGGENTNPPLYNFQYSEWNQLQAMDIQSQNSTYFITNIFPLSYNTSIINLLANFRFYLASGGRFSPFIKIHSGVSFVGAELALKNASDWSSANIQIIMPNENPDDWDFGPPVLYSRGTSNSAEGRFPALNIGAGVGFEFQLNEKLSLYSDFTFAMVNSDILDGRPNLDFNQNTSRLERFNTFGNFTKFNVGVCYSLGEGFSVFSGSKNSVKSSGKGGRQHPYLPFYELKRAR